jgi:hypothetical protein
LAVATWELHYLIASILPWTMSAVLWLRRPAPVAVLVDQDALRRLDARPEIAYESLRAVTVPGAPGAASQAIGWPQPLVIHHDAGHLLLPPVMNVPPQELYEFLQSKVPKRDTSVHAALEGFYREQVSKFGESKVHVTNTRVASRTPHPFSTSAKVGMGLFFGGVLTFAAGVAVVATGHEDLGYEVWIVVGVLLFIAGGIFWLASRSYSSQPNRALARNPDACIVISPGGLAMVQGDMRGTLRWEEITGTRMGAARFLDMPNQKGLELSIRGGRIIVYDIYDLPLPEVDRLIQQNLREKHPE